MIKPVTSFGQTGDSYIYLIIFNTKTDFGHKVYFKCKETSYFSSSTDKSFAETLKIEWLCVFHGKK